MSSDPLGKDLAAAARWTDPALPTDERVDALLGEMTLVEKLAQLASVWVGVECGEDGGHQVAPHQHDMNDERSFQEITQHGIGQLTRVYGTRPVEPVDGARALAATQRTLQENSRLGIPAMVHEECLSGLTAYRAAVFPTPLAWAASWDPETVQQMTTVIGSDMRSLGVHQGLAPVLDVVRDARWGRVEETLGEDPYLVGVLATAYVQGLESTGIIATLKHFAGYSASRAGRNLAPVSMGPREFADVILPPFEMALREGGARSVMHSYTDIDGMPSVADDSLLTTLLRERWGFTGVVVADYFGIAFLQLLHGLAGSPGEAAALALRAGVDLELPTVNCYGEPLHELVSTGRFPVELVDRALRRVLRHKVEIGLLDPDWTPVPPVLAGAGTARVADGSDIDLTARIDLDSPAHREIARRLAERSIVLLSNQSSTLPLSAESLERVCVVGPCADNAFTFMGCYSFPNHVGAHHPTAGLGIEVPTLIDVLREQLPQASVDHVRGCEVDGTDRSGFAQAVQAARSAQVCLAVLGDRAGLFGEGTSGEGCDAEDLSLPGVQGELLSAVLETGTPVVLVTVSGRPYAAGQWADRLAAHLQVFFPGEEGAAAITDVLLGQVNPSGRLPVQIPRTPGGQPATYLHAPLAGKSEVSATDPTPLYPFGHGLGYTSFGYADLSLERDSMGTDEETTVSCVVTNTGERTGTEVVQLYLSDPVAQVTRPVRQLAGFARVTLDPAASARVTFRLHADRTSFTGRDHQRIVEPGTIEVHVGRSSENLPLTGALELTGAVRQVGHSRVLFTPVEVTPQETLVPGIETGGPGPDLRARFAPSPLG
jgi:beta-xylosidase